MENAGGKNRRNNWANRPGGSLPDYVHEFFDPTVPRKDRDRNHPAVDYLVGKDGVPGRYEEAITKHVDDFKRDYPDRADLLPREDMLRHARNGASKAVLLAKNANEVSQRLKNVVVGALQNATTPVLREKGRQIAIINAALTAAQSHLSAEHMFLEAIFNPGYITEPGSTWKRLSTVRQKRAAAEVVEPFTAQQVREAVDALAKSPSFKQAGIAKLNERLLVVLGHARRLRSLQKEIAAAKQAVEAAKAVRDALPMGAPRREAYNEFVRARNARDSLVSSVKRAKEQLEDHVEWVRLHVEKLKKEGRI